MSVTLKPNLAEVRKFLPGFEPAMVLLTGGDGDDDDG